MIKKIVIISIFPFLLISGCLAKDDQPDDRPVTQPSQYILVNGVDATPQSFGEVASVFGKTTDHETAIGVGFIISYLQLSPEEAAAKLKKYLALSREFDLPVIVQIDGEQWWAKRPDLWNWWDDTKPGYDPANRYNVEWAAWNPDSAVKIGWRNWGRQLRVLPMPNLMSPVYRKACHDQMKKLVPIVMDWWNELPAEKKYLLVGIKVGWESAIGVNNWYYPNGNQLLGREEREDPDYGLTTDSLPDRGVQTIGYAAVSTLGLASSGELKEADVTEVVRQHLDDLCRQAADMNVPRDRLFTHCGGWSQGETLYSAAVNDYSCPGWSFYQHAADPRKDVTAMNALEQSDAPYWGAVEWLYQGEHTKEQWTSAITNTLSCPGIRYFCIYNWGGIKANANCISAIREIAQR